jgi:diguanylate cyclase (GGDEF)-like protein
MSERAPNPERRRIAAFSGLAAISVACIVGALVADEPALAIPAAFTAAGGAVAGIVIDRRRAATEGSLFEARATARGLRRRLEALQHAVAEEEAARNVELGLPPTTDTTEWELDPVTGLLRERHLPVLLQQAVATARRRVLPVAVVFWELDGSVHVSAEARDQAITALGAIAWRNLRESDAISRLGEYAAVAVLVDSSEDGALLVAERVRESLRSSPIGDSITVSAGIACYPTHALDAAELVSRAGGALEVARASGYDRDHVTIAVSEG